LLSLYFLFSLFLCLLLSLSSSFFVSYPLFIFLYLLLSNSFSFFVFGSLLLFRFLLCVIIFFVSFPLLDFNTAYSYFFLPPQFYPLLS
jgi:hypothetical protein